MNKEEYISKCNAVYALLAIKEMLPEDEKSLVGNADSLISYFTNELSKLNSHG